MTGKRPVVPEGFTSQAIQPVVASNGSEPSGGGIQRRAWFGVLWCLVGSIFVPLVPVLANVLVTFGAATAFGCGSRRVRIATPLVAIAASIGLTFLLFGVYGLPMSVVSIACALVLAWLETQGRMSTGSLLFAAVMAALALIGADMASAAAQGTTVTELITTVVNEAVEANIAALDLDLDSTMVLLQTRDEMVAYWPTLYFVVALSMVVLSVLGSRVGARIAGLSVQANPLVWYDVPLWVAEVFAVGVVAQVIGPMVAPQATEVVKLGANAVMCMRIALAQQGLSVLHWLVREHKVKPLAGMGLILIAVWLELSFALTSIAGLLDVIFNFRRLERGRPSIVLRFAQKR
jgi:hypothetical protein